MVSKPKTNAKRTRRIFATISQTGICDERGRGVYTIGWKGRSIADTDKPVAFLVATLMERLRDALGWDNAEQAKADFDTAIKYLKQMKSEVGDSGAETPDGR